MVPGLDFCFCKTCREYYPTRHYYKDEREREERKQRAIAQRKAIANAKKQGIDPALFNSSTGVQSVSHHEYENDYE